MTDAGASSQAIAQMEIDAWTRVTQRHNLLAADQATVEANLAAARHDLESASYQSSVDWIAKEEQAMKESGATDVDVAKMRYDAYHRMAQRNIYDLQEQKEIADSLASAQQALTQALESQLLKARELDRDADLKKAQDDADAAEKAIQDRIDALDKQAAAQQAVNKLIDEQTKLTDLQRQRDEVAADKRFHLIQRDKDGNLVDTLTADTAKLADLDKQIADQKKTIEQTRADQELAAQKAKLDAELKAQQKHDKDVMAAKQAYWTQMTSQEQIAQDTHDAIVKKGLDQATKDINAYADNAVKQYQRAQAALMALGGATPPSSTSTSTGGGSSSSGGDYKKGSPDFDSNGNYTGDPGAPARTAAAVASTPSFVDQIAQTLQAIASRPTSAQLAAQAVMANTRQPAMTSAAAKMVVGGGIGAGVHIGTLKVQSASDDPRKVAMEVQAALLDSVRKL
jgi:hypothetical protein